MLRSGPGVCVLSPKSVGRCHRRLERRRPERSTPSFGSSRARPPSPRGSLPDECIGLPRTIISCAYVPWAGWGQPGHDPISDHRANAATMTTHLYGRRMWQMLSAYWPTGESDPSGTPETREFARYWNAGELIVSSRTLQTVDHGACLVHENVVRTRLRSRLATPASGSCSSPASRSVSRWPGTARS